MAETKQSTPAATRPPGELSSPRQECAERADESDLQQLLPRLQYTGMQLLNTLPSPCTPRDQPPPWITVDPCNTHRAASPDHGPQCSSLGRLWMGTRYRKPPPGGGGGREQILYHQVCVEKGLAQGLAVYNCDGGGACRVQRVWWSGNEVLWQRSRDKQLTLISAPPP